MNRYMQWQVAMINVNNFGCWCNFNCLDVAVIFYDCMYCGFENHPIICYIDSCNLHVFFLIPNVIHQNCSSLE